MPDPVANLFELFDANTGDRLSLRPEVVIAGYTGRDADALEAHLAELEAHGVPRPETVPTYYPVPADLLTASGETIVTGPGTSGEVEPVLILIDDAWWIGVGSDHTDRELERSDIAASKRACAKVLGDGVARWDRLRDRWGEVLLSARADGCAYQRGAAHELRDPEELLAGAVAALGHRPEQLVLFLGTVPLRDGSFRFARDFSAALQAPFAGVTLELSYRVEVTGGDGRGSPAAGSGRALDVFTQ